MRKFILIAGFVLASAAAQAGDRSLSLGVNDTQRAPAPAKAIDAPKTAEAPQAVEAPRYVERPAIVEPKAETPKAEAPKADTPKAEAPRPTAKAARLAAQRSGVAPSRPAFRRTASMSRGMRPVRLYRNYRLEARIIHALHRYGIYW
ncbi:hypothetical protein J6524_27730 [Bradyrhizobium sp. WSM 1738]|uniref:hypothetical protein n=1 Tax=Bradyrhizobium hereditatis TaxID=2821405 RepID=UPI001CE3929D|nr:hypothetical protein [Bradyrhizobium hereditatis]MCA6118640.1 hypothetical protein [Bradyrhizobium hereditatis]